MESNKVKTLSDKISKVTGEAQFPRLSAIEFDILMQNLRDLYTELDTMRNTKGVPVKRRADSTIHETSHPEELLIHKTLHANQNILLNDIHSKEEEETAVPVQQEEKMAEIKIEKQAPSPASVFKGSINESIRTVGSLNEKLRPSSLKEVHKVNAPKHLKDMIDLNKKFVLMNELFKGDKDQFAYAVSHIDGLPDYRSAEEFINHQLIASHRWDENSQTVRMFIRLVKSKFGEE